MYKVKTIMPFLAGMFASMIFGFSNPVSTQVPMDESHWEVTSENYKFETHLGKQSLFLPQGFAMLNEVVFHNGIIEFDMAFPEGRGFPGIGFRIQDDQNYEELYIRPHQSGNPDANQYTPIFNGLAGWQLYHGEGHGAPVSYKYNAWNHIKLVINGTHGEVYINDMDQPIFQIFELKHGDVEGPIGLKGNANSHFANFSYSLLDNPPMKLPPKKLLSPDKLTILNYQVSEAVEDKLIAENTNLNLLDLAGLSWTHMEVEYTGTLNIAKAIRRAENKNTSLVKISIFSDTDQLKKLEFGYSDIAHVFLNNKALYAGQRQFRSRDYRYLGTIGYFDSIYLDLKKGENELVFAVTETFGGWGLKAKWTDQEGITVK